MTSHGGGRKGQDFALEPKLGIIFRLSIKAIFILVNHLNHYISLFSRSITYVLLSFLTLQYDISNTPWKEALRYITVIHDLSQLLAVLLRPVTV